MIVKLFDAEVLKSRKSEILNIFAVLVVTLFEDIPHGIGLQPYLIFRLAEVEVHRAKVHLTFVLLPGLLFRLTLGLTGRSVSQEEFGVIAVEPVSNFLGRNVPEIFFIGTQSANLAVKVVLLQGEYFLDDLNERSKYVLFLGLADVANLLGSQMGEFARKMQQGLFGVAWVQLVMVFSVVDEVFFDDFGVDLCVGHF